MALQHIYNILGVEGHQSETYGRSRRNLAQAFCLAAIGGMECVADSPIPVRKLDKSGNVNPTLFEAWQQGAIIQSSPSGIVCLVY
jgi:hypothetical protein